MAVVFGAAAVAGDRAPGAGVDCSLRRTTNADERTSKCNAQHRRVASLSWSSNCDAAAAYGPAPPPVGHVHVTVAGGCSTETVCVDAIHKGRQQRPRNKSLEEEIASLNYEMERIQFQCQQLVDKHTRQRRSKSDDRFEAEAHSSSSNYQSPRLVPRMGTRLQDFLAPLPRNSTISHCSVHVDDQSVYRTQIHFKAKEDKATPVEQWHSIGSLSPCKRFYQALALQKRSNGADPSFPRGSIQAERNSERSTSRPEKPPVVFSRRALGFANYKTSMELGVASSQAKAEAATKGGVEAGSSGNLAMQLTQQRYHQMTHAEILDCKHHSMESDTGKKQQHLQQFETRLSMQNVHSSLLCSASVSRRISNAAQQAVHRKKSPSSAFIKGGGGEMVRGGAECEVGETGSGKVRKQFVESVDIANGVFREKTKDCCSLSPSKVLITSTTPGSPQSKIPCRPSASSFTGGGGGVEPAAQGERRGAIEWVVKRRSDGTRYVMRRPTRNRVLKERARQLAEERCSSTTTDDDAASELKRGRYWNRDARRRHLEMAKDRKSRKEMMQQQQQEARESARLSCSRGHQHLQLDIVEMSRRRQIMQRQNKLFDNFTTLQELLAHGNREPPPYPSSSTVVNDGLHSHRLRQLLRYQRINPLLSVTTV